MDPLAKWSLDSSTVSDDPLAKWSLDAKPGGDWRDEEARANLEAIQPTPKDPGTMEVRGNILPLSRNVETNKLSLAVPGFIQDPATLPGDVYTGKVDPQSDEGGRRALGFAMATLPSNVARGAKMRPGAPEAKAPSPPKNSDVFPTQSLKDLQQGFYKESKDAGMVIKGDSYGQFVGELAQGVKKAGIDKKLTPHSYAAMERLWSEIPRQQTRDPMSPVTGIEPKPNTKTFSLEDIDTLRKVVGDARKTKSPELKNDRRVANIIADRIDDWLENGLQPGDIAAGDPAKALGALKAGRGITVRMKKAEILDEIKESALDRVGANYTNAGMQTAIRQEFKRIRKNDYLFRKFDPKEQTIIKEIIRGVSMENALRYLGKFSPSSPLAAVISLSVGHTAGGPVGAAALMGVGAMAAKKSASMGQRKFDQLNALVRRGYDEEGASY
jgi:hypothetical protein